MPDLERLKINSDIYDIKATNMVEDVEYNTFNNAITKSIEGVETTVVTVSTLKTDMELDNVENKSSAVIRSEITSANITDALGYTPPRQDTTYESKPAQSGGTELSLVTTGEKATWDSKGTITGITMNGASKGTSGVVDLGTVLTSHQDISGKADKSNTVSDVAYDSNNKKFVETINGVTSDIVTLSTIKSDMNLDNVENKSSATIRSEITSANVVDALGYTPMDASGITYSDVISALGFTPLDVATKGESYGVAELDANGMVPSSQLPSYVDDILEFQSISSFPETGESGKIYVDISTKLVYRWGGSDYVEISPSLALGETSDTAYRGDYGKAAYDHASANGSAFVSGLYKITTNAEGHVTGAVPVEKDDIVDLGIPGADTDTHREIQVDGVQVLADNDTPLNLISGNNVTLTDDGMGGITIDAQDTTNFVPTDRTINGHALSRDISLDYTDVDAAPSSTVSCTSQNVLSALGTGSGTSRFFREDGTWVTPSGGGTVTEINAGVGLAGGQITQSGTLKASLKSEVSSTLEADPMGAVTGRQYAVGVDLNGHLSVNIPWEDNTAGSTDSSSKLYLIGALSQTGSSETYSHDTAYVDTDGCLYSNNAKVVTAGCTWGDIKGV